MFAASPSPKMEAAFGRLHNGGRAAFGRPPTVVETITFGRPPAVVETIMGDGEAAHIANTYAIMYKIFVYLYILPIL